jgi:hypothetical protein
LSYEKYENYAKPLFFPEPGKRILKYTEVGFTAFKNYGLEEVMQFALNTHFFPNPLTLFLIVSGAGGSFEKGKNGRKLPFFSETDSRIFIYMTAEFTVCDLLEPRGI